MNAKEIKISALTAVRMGIKLRIDAYPFEPEYKKHIQACLATGEKMKWGDLWIQDIFARVISELPGLTEADMAALKEHLFK